MHMKIKYNPYDPLYPWVVLFPCDNGALIFMCKEETLQIAYRQAVIYHYYMRMEEI